MFTAIGGGYIITNFTYEYRGLTDWITGIKIELMSGEYTNRSKLQRKLISLEKARANLVSRRNDWKK